MKRLSILFFAAFLSFFILVGCSSTVDNWIKIQNLASNDIYLNFRANLVHVKSGDTVRLNELPNGKYDYETIYEIPGGTTASGTEGEAAGEFVIKAGTKILIVYTSTFIDGTYTLFASVTSSDDLDDTDPNPIGP